MDICSEPRPNDIHQPHELHLWFVDGGPGEFEVERCDDDGCDVCATAEPRPVAAASPAVVVHRAA